MANPVEATSAILDCAMDWAPRYAIIKDTAIPTGVFEYIDIDSETPPARPCKPVYPKFIDVKADATAFSALTRKEREDYKFLVSLHRTQLGNYKDMKRDLGDIHKLIQATVALQYKPYVSNTSTPYRSLMTLKHRVADTGKAQRLELSREYQALKNRSKGQSVEKWFSSWETTYAKAEKFNLPEIRDNQGIYDFIFAMRSIDFSYANAYSINLGLFISDDPAFMPTFYQVLENFRENCRRNSARHAWVSAQGREEVVQY
jgi:hypothetical protein